MTFIRTLVPFLNPSIPTPALIIVGPFAGTVMKMPQVVAVFNLTRLLFVVEPEFAVPSRVLDELVLVLTRFLPGETQASWNYLEHGTGQPTT